MLFAAHQTRVGVIRPATLRGVAGNVDEGILLTTFGADRGWCLSGDEKAALGALPVGKSASGANISLKPTLVGVTAIRAGEFFFAFIQSLHFMLLSLLNGLNAEI
jgi:hypothetical protein